jgi:hypothetical protein
MRWWRCKASKCLCSGLLRQTLGCHSQRWSSQNGFSATRRAHGRRLALHGPRNTRSHPRHSDAKTRATILTFTPHRDFAVRLAAVELVCRMPCGKTVPDPVARPSHLTDQPLTYQITLTRALLEASRTITRARSRLAAPSLTSAPLG